MLYRKIFSLLPLLLMAGQAFGQGTGAIKPVWSEAQQPIAESVAAYTAAFNTGDVAGKFSLVVAKKADVGGFGQKLLLTITDGTTTWQKTVDNMLGTINLGTINPGAANAKVYTITAEFPDTGVNASGVGNENGYMGAAVTVVFTWNAITP